MLRNGISIQIKVSLYSVNYNNTRKLKLSVAAVKTNVNAGVSGLQDVGEMPSVTHSSVWTFAHLKNPMNTNIVLS